MTGGVVGRKEAHTVMDEGLKKVELEDRESPEGGCNLAGGSNISLQQCHRRKHTNRRSWKTVVFERWSVWGGYSAATGTNTYRPGEVSDSTVYSKLYTVYCMVVCRLVCVCVHVRVCV